MVRYIIKRVLWLIPVIICVSLIIFTLLELTPGTVVDSMMSEGMTQEDRAALIAKYNLDKPMLYRYGLYMFRLIQGDLGVADRTGLNVWNLFITRLPNTLLLSFTALIIGAAISIPIGVIAARKAGTLTDSAVTGFSLLGMSMPLFWLGLLLMLLFSYVLGWLPSGGNNNGIRSLILPAICASVGMIAQTSRQARSNMLDVLHADYLRTARAKGVPEKLVIRKHALSNAWIPILTALGTSLTTQLAGSVVVESVFAWPGIGSLAASAVTARDVTLTCGVVIMTTILYVLTQLIVDILYAFVDPRIKSQYVGAGRRKRLTSTRALSRAADKPIEQVPVVAAETAPEPALAALGAGPEEESGVIDYASAAAETEYRNVFQAVENVVPDEQTVPEEEKRDAAVASGPKKPYVVEPTGLVSRKYRKRSQMGEIVHHISKNKSAVIGFFILCAIFLAFIISLFMDMQTINKGIVADRFSAPSWQYPFGTDGMGRSVLLRVIYGTRYSLAIGFGAVLISTVLGVTLGSVSGYYGGRVDDVIMRISDILASIPGLLLGMVIMTMLEQNLQNLILAVGLTGAPVFIRMTRASILTVRNNEFVEAAHAIGLRNPRIIFTHVLPNGLSPVIITVTASLGITIVVAASLSFLGFGVPVPHPEWGTMVAGGREYARSAPWLMSFPGAFIMLTVLAFNLLGDGLRDALDPKLKR